MKYLLLVAVISIPAPAGFVNDFANIIDQPTRQELESSLSQYEKATSIEIAVATIPSLEGREVEEYTNQLFHAWGVGKREKNNGILIVVAPNEHRMRIEVGYGMEPDLTDLQSKEIVDTMTPLFKEGKYSAGIALGVQRILQTLGPTPFSQRQEERRRQKELADLNFQNGLRLTGMVIAIVAILFLIGMAIVAIERRIRAHRLLQEKNVARIGALQKTVLYTERSRDAAIEDLTSLKNTQPLPVWRDLARAIPQFKLQAELQHIIELDRPDRTHQTAQALGVLESHAALCEDFAKVVNARAAKVRSALESIPRLLAGQPAQLFALFEQSKHPDVTPETRKLWEKVSGNFTRITQDTNQNCLERYTSLFGIASAITAVADRIKADKAYAEKARKEGPELLASIPTLLANAEKEVSVSALAPARERWEKSQESHPGEPVNWAIAFTELTAIATLIQAAISRVREEKEDEERRERRRREESSYSSSSSSSYGSSSSSDGGSSFGGFGGGDSGSGGASGSW